MDHANPPNHAPGRRLDSWKEIALFFSKDVRTVRRWEKERALPVHRAPGKPGGSVYAFTNELTEWLNSSDLPADEIGSAEETEPSHRSRDLILVLGALVFLVVAGVGITWFVRSRTAHVSGPAASTGGRGSSNPEAVDLYLKGRFEWNKRTPESLNKAVDYFTQAIVHDPSYAQAYAGLADTYNLLREYTAMPSNEAFPRAIAAAKKAVELDDSLSEAHRALAFASFNWEWDFSGAEREFKRAIELNPKDATAYHWYATSLLTLGRFSEALAQIEESRRLDPTSISILADRALILFYSGREAESAVSFKQIETSDPTFLSPHRYQAALALDRGDYRTYLAELKKEMELTHDAAGIDLVKAVDRGYAAGGAKELLNTLFQAQKKSYERGDLSAYFLAETCALAGKRREAIQYLQESFKKHETAVISIRVDRALLSLHDDPAYKDLVSRVGLAPVQ
jgi:tetratricopeptide (TPR) repeat protein